MDSRQQLIKIRNIRKQLISYGTELNKDQGALRTQLDHINNIEFLILNIEKIAKSKVINFGEREAREASMEPASYAQGLTMHFEHVSRNSTSRRIEILEQIDTFFKAYDVAVEVGRLDGYFAALGFGACIQAKTAHLDSWQKRVGSDRLELKELMHEYLWRYESANGDVMTNEMEKQVVSAIVQNHLGQAYVDKNEPKVLDCETVKNYLININYYDEQSFAHIAIKPNLPKKQANATQDKPSGNRVVRFFKNHWKGILIGAAVGLLITGGLIAAGIVTGGAVPLLVAGVAAVHITVSHVGAIAIGSTAVAVTATATGAATGGLVGTIHDKIKSSTAKISRRMKISPSAPTEEIAVDADQRKFDTPKIVDRIVSNNPYINNEYLFK